MNNSVNLNNNFFDLSLNAGNSSLNNSPNVIINDVSKDLISKSKNIGQSELNIRYNRNLQLNSIKRRFSKLSESKNKTSEIIQDTNSQIKIIDETKDWCNRDYSSVDCLEKNQYYKILFNDKSISENSSLLSNSNIKNSSLNIRFTDQTDKIKKTKFTRKQQLHNQTPLSDEFYIPNTLNQESMLKNQNNFISLDILNINQNEANNSRNYMNNMSETENTKIADRNNEVLVAPIINDAIQSILPLEFLFIPSFVQFLNEVEISNDYELSQPIIFPLAQLSQDEGENKEDLFKSSVKPVELLSQEEDKAVNILHKLGNLAKQKNS